jgi:LmbE family N-acetylglucosaminyl deacetylase
VRRFLVPLARRLSEANLMARAVARRDPDLVLPPELVAAPRRAIVVAPHADDESIGCGGTLALCESAAVVLLTAPESRHQEALAACEVLGVPTLEALGFADGRVPDDEASAALLRALFERLAPDVVLVPWPLERHPDHAAAARLTARALVGTPTRVWCYEVWSPLDPNRLVDITSVATRKRAAIDCHASQVAALPYADAVLGLNRYRALLAPGVDYAEAFFECDADALLRLAPAR